MGEDQACEGNLRGSLGKIRCSITLPDAAIHSNSWRLQELELLQHFFCRCHRRMLILFCRQRRHPPLFADDLLAEYPIRIGAVDMVSFLWMDIDE